MVNFPKNSLALYLVLVIKDYESGFNTITALTAMIILHFHLQPQFIYELFHINFTSIMIMIMNLYSAFSIFIYSNALYRHAHLLLNSVELIQIFPLMNTADSIILRHLVFLGSGSL